MVLLWFHHNPRRAHKWRIAKDRVSRASVWSSVAALAERVLYTCFARRIRRRMATLRSVLVARWRHVAIASIPVVATTTMAWSFHGQSSCADASSLGSPPLPRCPQPLTARAVIMASIGQSQPLGDPELGSAGGSTSAALCCGPCGVSDFDDDGAGACRGGSNDLSVDDSWTITAGDRHGVERPPADQPLARNCSSDFDSSNDDEDEDEDDDEAFANDGRRLIGAPRLPHGNSSALRSDLGHGPATTGGTACATTHEAVLAHLEPALRAAGARDDGFKWNGTPPTPARLTSRGTRNGVHIYKSAHKSAPFVFRLGTCSIAAPWRDVAAAWWAFQERESWDELNTTACEELSHDSYAPERGVKLVHLRGKVGTPLRAVLWCAHVLATSPGVC